jgi:Arginine deiminase
MLWLDERTLLVGRGYRTNAEAHRQLARILAREDATPERWTCRTTGSRSRAAGHVGGLAGRSGPRGGVRAARPGAAARGAAGPRGPLDPGRRRRVRQPRLNVLAVRPDLAIMADGNPRTRRALEAAGCEVHVYQAWELSKGDGGPTCLARPIRRSDWPSRRWLGCHREGGSVAPRRWLGATAKVARVPPRTRLGSHRPCAGHRGRPTWHASVRMAMGHARGSTGSRRPEGRAALAGGVGESGPAFDRLAAGAEGRDALAVGTGLRAEALASIL